jgi:hypothetical protein
VGTLGRQRSDFLSYNICLFKECHRHQSKTKIWDLKCILICVSLNLKKKKPRGALILCKEVILYWVFNINYSIELWSPTHGTINYFTVHIPVVVMQDSYSNVNTLCE